MIITPAWLRRASRVAVILTLRGDAEAHGDDAHAEARTTTAGSCLVP